MQITKPKKQRRMLFQAPDHVRHKHLAAPLSSELRASHGVKSIPVRTGDTVRIMRGDFKGFEGKITRIDIKDYRVYVEGLKREKVDGTAIFASIHPSKVMITKLNLEDRWRKEVLKRKKEAQKTEQVPQKPPPEEVAETKENAEEKSPKKKPKTRKKKATKKRTKRTKKEKKLKKKVKAKRKTTKKTEGGN